jgi:small-conductance mechanosensitive channel
LDGTVVSVGLMYTTMATSEGTVNIPNSGLLGAAVGPLPSPAEDDQLNRLIAATE